MDSLKYSQAFLIRQVPENTQDSLAIPSIEQAESLFQSSKDISSFTPVLVEHGHSFQAFWFLTVSMLLVAILLNTMRKRYVHYFLSYFSDHYRIDAGDREDKLGIIARLLNVLFLVNLSLLLYKLFDLLGLHVHFVTGINDFWIFSALVVLTWLTKSFITVLVHFIFTSFNQGFQLLKINQQAEYVASLFLIPFNFILYYSFSNLFLAYIFLGFIAIILLIGLAKLYLLLKQISSFYPYQIFIYLCTLEILPVVTIVKYYITSL